MSFRERSRVVPAAALLLAAALATSGAQGGTKLVADGGVQNARGGWDLPKQGACPADPTAKSRAECLARRYDAASSSACTALGPAGSYSWSTGVCTDLVNTAKSACEGTPDRFWNANGTCAVVMGDDNRNATSCAKRGGTWVTTGSCTAAWKMPSRSDPAYGAAGLLVNDSSTGSAGAGDQCLRCHNSVTQYNGPRVRDVEHTLTMGHKNMSRPVDQTGFKPWGGPPFTCTGHASATTREACVAAGGTWDPAIYPSDDAGNVIDWTKNTIKVGANTYDLKWVYGDWLAPFPRAIYAGPTLNNMSYSCGRCHTTGWTSDAGTTPNASKHPEVDFPGITWTGTGTTGQVKTAGGVAGDTNVMSSWDQWGITCSRCHYAAVDDTTAAPNLKAPAGMSMHHNNLTVPNNNSGVCTDVRFGSAPTGSTLEELCTANGGQFLTACSVNPTPGVCTVAASTPEKCAAVTGASWMAAPAGWCSNGFYKESGPCTANGFTWSTGWCKTADAQAACTGGTGDGAKTWRLNGTQASCQVAGATWSFTSCTVEGFCSKGTCSDPSIKTAFACEAAGKHWSPIQTKASCDAVGGNFAYAGDAISCEMAGGRWFGNNFNRGQMITSLCMQCHRQESSGWPNTNGTCSKDTATTQGACIAAGGIWTETGNGIGMLVGPYHGTVGFPSHPHSNQFLNSPHAKFTGKWSEIATGRFDLSADRKYSSAFMSFGEAYRTGNGCTGCHDVHESIMVSEEPFRSNCAQCHHVKSLEDVQHPSGAGTPLEEMEHKPMEACVSCHMPGGLHLFRINTDKSYSTFPMPQAMAGNVAPSTAPDGTFTNAVWVDVDLACGRCHGGGAAHVTTTGTVAAGSATLTVADATGITAGEKIVVAGAGAYAGPGVNEDFPSYVKAVSGKEITLAGKVTRGVTNAAVTLNATTDEARYMTKEALALAAEGMHGDPSARFETLRGENEMTVAVDASKTRCRGASAGCDAFEWSWGDGTRGSGLTATHTYSAPGAYEITLTARRGAESGRATQPFVASPVPGAPVVAGGCTPRYATASVECTLTVPAGGYRQVSIDFGDGAASESANASPGLLTFTHTYGSFDNYTVKATVVGPTGLRAEGAIGSLARASFVSEMPVIAGRVLGADGAPVARAQVTVLRDGRAVQSAMSAEDGSWSTGRIMHGTYTITVERPGHSFAAAYGPYTVGPSLRDAALVAER